MHFERDGADDDGLPAQSPVCRCRERERQLNRLAALRSTLLLRRNGGHGISESTQVRYASHASRQEWRCWRHRWKRWWHRGRRECWRRRRWREADDPAVTAKLGIGLPLDDSIDRHDAIRRFVTAESVAIHREVVIARSVSGRWFDVPRANLQGHPWQVGHCAACVVRVGFSILEDGGRRVTGCGDVDAVRESAEPRDSTAPRHLNSGGSCTAPRWQRRGRRRRGRGRLHSGRNQWRGWASSCASTTDTADVWNAAATEATAASASACAACASAASAALLRQRLGDEQSTHHLGEDGRPQRSRSKLASAHVCAPASAVASRAARAANSHLP